jgi:ribosomal protein S18 acetylase RimI-like enzyme
MKRLKVSEDMKIGELPIRQATPEDLSGIELFLRQEYAKTGRGFWHNWKCITDGQQVGDVYVVVQRGTEKVLSFCLCSLGRGDMSIIEVRPGYRRKGLGRYMTRWALDQLKDRGHIGVEIECAPEASLRVWRKMGFRRIEKTGQLGQTFAVYLFRERRTILGATENKSVAIQLTQASGEPLRSKSAVVEPGSPFRCRGMVRDTACILEEDFAAYLPLGSHHTITIHVEGYEAYSDDVRYSDRFGVHIDGQFIRVRELDLSRLHPVRPLGSALD